MSRRRSLHGASRSGTALVTTVTLVGLAIATASVAAVGRTALGKRPLIPSAAAANASALPAITSPLRVSATNTHFLVDAAGRAVYLAGSHTWDDLQDMDLMPATPTAFDFTAYVNFMVAHGQNLTILWRKDLPTFCNWGAGGTWRVSQFPWLRTGPGVASDGLPAFDLTQFDQSYFDRLRARVVQLDQNNVYAMVELFDGLQLINNRCLNDGYPFSAGNNVNGLSDGGGTGSMTMIAPNNITAFQDAYVQKVIDTLNDLPNVLWEVSEEAPSNSTWWQDHMISLIHTYEAGKPLQHPVGYSWLTGGSDSTLYASAADWVAPSAKIAPTNNLGSKVIVNDSDHSYYGMWNDSAQTNRNFLWENLTNGASVLFMDPYEIYWSAGSRNICQAPANGVCSAVDPRWENFRSNLGYAVSLADRMDLSAMNPQPSLSSTGWALANDAATGSEFLVYAPNGGSFTVNLSKTSDSLDLEWLNPSTGVISSGGSVAGGSPSQSFTPPFAGDAVLHIWDPLQSGRLRVVSSPAVPTQILVDGHTADSWGLAWLSLPAGPHTIAFTHVEGYTEPAPQTVTITPGTTTTVTGTFVPRGTLRVITSPPVPSEITVDGRPGDDWGLWTDVPTGSHQVCFGAVADYAPPPCQTVTVVVGTTTTITGAFAASRGAIGQLGVGLLRVTSSPSVPSQITITPDAGSPYITDSWGLNWLELPPGSYTVAFSHVPGYSEPLPRTVVISAGATTTVNGLFANRGTLRVTTSPAVDGTIALDGNPTDNWGLWTDVPTGSHQVCFGSVAGYTAPPCQTVSVTADIETDATGTYT